MRERNNSVKNQRSENQKGIFICGAGLMQVPLVKLASEMGLYTVCADANPQAAAAGLADRFCRIDLKNRKKMASAVAAFARKGIIHGVVTAATDFSATVAFAAEKASLPGISFETALNASDKGRMRAVFSKAGVPSPAFAVISSPQAAVKPENLAFPLVIKPVDNMGARGIRLASSEHELTQAVREAYPYSRSGKIIIEEYIDGPEFSIDALVYKGKITICGIADRHIFFPPYFIEMGHTIPSGFRDDTITQITDVFCSGVKALGIDNGAAKGDIKLGKNGPVVGEIAARLSGGYMSGWTFPYSSGLEVTRGAIRIALGEDPGSLKPQFDAVSAERAWISIPGQIDSIRGLRSAVQTTNVKDVLPRTAAGDRVVFPRNNVEKCGNVISAAADRDTAVQSATAAVQKIYISLKEGDSETENFLFSDNSWPWAFSEDLYKNLDRKSMSYTKAANATQLPRVFTPLLPGNMKEMGKHTDWHGTPLSLMLEELYKEPYYQEKDGFELGAVFWKAVLKGGRQGADWLARTLLTAQSSGQLGEMLAKWQ